MPHHDIKTGVPESASARWEMQLLSTTVPRGNAEIYHRSGLVLSREQGLRCGAGFALAACATECKAWCRCERA